MLGDRLDGLLLDPPHDPVICDSDQQQPPYVLASAATPLAIVSAICSLYSIVGDSGPTCLTSARTRSIVMSDTAAYKRAWGDVTCT
jgi:hypothetical protein